LFVREVCIVIFVPNGLRRALACAAIRVLKIPGGKTHRDRRRYGRLGLGQGSRALRNRYAKASATCRRPHSLANARSGRFDATLKGKSGKMREAAFPPVIPAIASVWPPASGSKNRSDG